jgi:photosystem II stability/assembly factor-like uncharacterized protein
VKDFTEKKRITKSLLLAAIIISVAGISTIYFSKQPYATQRKKQLKTSSEEIIQNQKNKKLERRKNGYAKPDKPDMFVHYLNALKTRKGKSEYIPNHKMLELKSALARQTRLKSAMASLPWEQRGPGDVGGRTRAILIDPDDNTGNTWFVGAVSGGIWKTTDAGQTWNNISINIPNLAIVSLAMAPSNTNVIYAGTGEGYYNVDAVKGNGILKSYDKGQTWSQLSQTTNTSYFSYVNSIVVSHNNDSVVWAATNRAVVKSTDGGVTWTNVTPEQGGVGTNDNPRRYQKIIIHPSNENILWVTLYDHGIFKSEDGGDTWFLTHDLSGEGRIEITVSKSNPEVLYAMNESSVLYYSFDGGEEWALGVETTTTNFLSGQGWYNNSLAINPSDDSKGFIGGVDFYNFTLGSEVTDAGEVAFSVANGVSSFMDFDNFYGTHLKGGLKLFSLYNLAYGDVELQFGSGKTQKAHRFTDSTFYYNIELDLQHKNYNDLVSIPFKVVKKSTGQMLDVSFVDFNQNGKFDLYANSYEIILIHDATYSGTANSNITSSISYSLLAAIYPQLPKGGTWDEISLPTANLTIHPYELRNRSLSASKLTSWYASKSASNYSHADHHKIVINSSSGTPFSIIVGNDGGIGYSSDGGATWSSRVSGYITSQFYGVSRHPKEYIYFGGLQDNGSQLSLSNPSTSSSWSEVLGGDGFDVVWHSREPDKIIGSIYYNDLRKSDDGGQTWGSIGDFIGDNSADSAPFITKIASSKADPDLLFVGGQSGLWKSTNFGDSWTNIPMGSDWGYDGYATPMIAISKANTDIVWAGIHMNSDVNYTVGKIHVSTDGGENFAALDNIMDMGAISNIITHPTEDSTAYVLFSFAYYPKVFRTTDLGQTWEDISGFGLFGSSSSSNGFPNAAINTLLVMPFDTDEIWAGTEIGLFISYDNGANWSFASNGIPAVSIWDMKIVGDEIVLGTHGLGVWSVKRNELSNTIKNPFVKATGFNTQGNIAVQTLFEENLDSIIIYNENGMIDTYYNIIAGERTDIVNSSIYPSNDIYVKGYLGGVGYKSNKKEVIQIDVKAPVQSYLNNFNETSNDFTGNGFTITTGILSNGAIQTPHPYEENSTYYYTLNYPVVVSSDANVAYIKYHDIAFIETGEIGSQYSDADFYDYVVVEGSKDGIVWLPLKDGYDFSYSSVWDSEGRTYHSAPDSKLYVEHQINLYDTFIANDTIFVRFKLHSDPYESGWGWAIDNLRIQDNTSAINSFANDSFEAVIYPNPAISDCNILLNNSFVGNVDICIYSTDGQLVFKQTYFKNTVNFTQKIPLNKINAGTYVINIAMDNKKSSNVIVIK